MNSIARSAIPVALVVGLTGCLDFADFGDSERYKEDFHYSYALTPGGTLSIENTNGSVEVQGWDQNTVDVNGTKYASSRSLLDSVKIEASATPGAVRIRTARPLETHGGAGARYVIHVPRKIVLDSIATTNGAIRVEDVQGNARLRSTNGSIRVQAVHGDLEAQSTNGSLEIENLVGSANLRTSNGSIKAEAEHGSLEASTSNGSINGVLTDAATNWPVKLHSSNGRIELRLKGGRIPDVRADTSNSSITLHLPEGVNARVSARTSHASISSDFDVASTRRGTDSKDVLEGNIGSGGPTLDLSSTNGSIKILKF